MRNEELGTKIKRADILALKSQAASLRDELGVELGTLSKKQWSYKLFSEEFDALGYDVRLAQERVNTAKDVIENLLQIEMELDDLGVLI